MSKNRKDESLIKQLKVNIPEIDKIFNLHRKIGCGTFSSVFLATIKNDKQSKKCFAIKHLIPTTHPQRLEKELSCLLRIGGKNNVVGVEICFRNMFSVAFVMPYIPHDKFHEYFDKLSPFETQHYMKNLLIAIAHVHSHDIIHRDIKPSNFLFNRAAKTFLLVDFGLAQDLKKTPTPKDSGGEDSTNPKRKLGVEDLTTPAKKRQCLPSTDNIANVENKDSSDNKVANFLFKTPLKQRNQFMNDTSSYHTTPLAQNLKSTIVGISVNLKMASPSNGGQNTSNSNQKTTKDRANVMCFCYGKSQVCNLCIVKKEMQASRAGTPGYRAVEVLLKYADQNQSVDVWSVGVIFLSLLSKCYPFFKSHDDYEALAEIITIFGDSKLKKTALALGRHLKVGHKKQPLNLQKMCQTLRKRQIDVQGELNKSKNNKGTKKNICNNCQQTMNECICLKNSTHLEMKNDEYTTHAYDLLTKLLEVNPKNRISAQNALEHPYFTVNY